MSETDDIIQKRIVAAKRLLAVREARERMLPFMRLTMPDPTEPANPDKSRFVETPQARLLCQIIEQMKAGKMKRVAVSIGPQHGKALQIDTPIPTPDGWKRIVDLQVGDVVFDDKGKRCSVVAKTPVWRNRPVCRVSFDDKHEVIADEEHEWLVRMSKSYDVYKKKTTKQIMGRAAARNVKVPKAGPLDLSEKKFPIDPYALGVWLGDGSKDIGYITAVGADKTFLEHKITAAGYTIRGNRRADTFLIVGFRSLLKASGLWRNKHIPPEYLRGSIRQRLALLQGLVDTDGYVGPKGQIEFCNTNRDIAEGVREIVHSLGFKCAFYEGRATLYGKDCGPKYRVMFYAPGAAAMPRKAARCSIRLARPERYMAVRPAGLADTVCIEVDSPSHMFLCGKGMIPTCNSQILSRGAPAWLSGQDPYANIMLGSYNQTFAEEFGGDVREIMTSPLYGLVFPKHSLRKGGTAKDFLVTEEGGKLSFVGVGGSGTGKPADYFFVDDPIRNDEDAQSAVYREKLWKWFTSVVFSRLLNSSRVLVVHTRWHQDDLIGRLCDPDHPERNKLYEGVSEGWEYINLPAVVEDPKLAESLGLTLDIPSEPKVIRAFGTKPMSALWPERKSLTFLAEAKKMDARVFGALYMGQPTPDDGEYFKKDDILEYDPSELPANLRKYGASDHAVGMKQTNDSTVLGCVGVDENDDIWVLPDLVWDRMQTDRTVDEVISQMKTHKPMMWWLESELISKSFGPFLIKRMQEEKVYTYLDPVSVAKTDKIMRARAIQGRMQHKKVHFPRTAPWYAEARAEMLKFPFAAHDDFVDFIAHIGRGLVKEIRASPLSKKESNDVQVGSIQWILRNAKSRAENEKRYATRKGW